jgi:two-component system probable response regulator PhcQ
MTDPKENSPAILFVDDEATAVKYFERAIGSLAPVITANSVEEGIRMLDAHADTLAVLVSDQRMPGKYGNELLRYAKDNYPHMVRILTTAYSELEHTVEAINEGQIHRYIKKPWEITTLRMELKQAVDFANLRKERDHLLREKMMVWQKQTLSNRIGTLNAFCIALLGENHFSAMESYLSAAHQVGVTAPEPNWIVMDYSDLVSAEGTRGGKLGYLLREQVNAFKARYPSYSDQHAFDLVAEAFGNGAQRNGESFVLLQPQVVTEFLETPSDASMSPRHVSWLAFLLWLDGHGRALQTAYKDNKLECHLTSSTVPVSPTRLADWIEQF